MQKILICDDNAVFLHQFSEILLREFAKKHVSVRIEMIQSGEALLTRLSQGSADAIFLDVEMPDRTGLEIGEKICKLYPKVVLFFVSSQEKYVFEAMRCKPLRYLRKHKLKEELPELIHVYLQEMKIRMVKIQFSGGRGLLTLNVHDILYVKSEGNYQIFHMEEEENPCRLRLTLAQVEKKLVGFHFVRCCSDCVINCRKIKEIRRESVELETGVLVPMSRAKQNDVRQAFAVVMRDML